MLVELLNRYDTAKERRELVCVSFKPVFTSSTYSAVRLAGEVLGSNQAGEEESNDRGLHCEDGFLFV